MFTQGLAQRSAPLPGPEQIADVRLAASKMTGATRRAFEAEMTMKYCGGNARQAEGVFGWGRHTVGLGTQAPDPRTPLSQAQFDRVTSPTKDTFGLAGVPAAVFHRHLDLKSAPRGAGHLRSSQAYVSDLLWTGQRSRSLG